MRSEALVISGGVQFCDRFIDQLRLHGRLLRRGLLRLRALDGVPTILVSFIDTSDSSSKTGGLVLPRLAFSNHGFDPFGKVGSSDQRS